MAVKTSTCRSELITPYKIPFPYRTVHDAINIKLMGWGWFEGKKKINMVVVSVLTHGQTRPMHQEMEQGRVVGLQGI